MEVRLEAVQMSGGTV